jgi:hypothetical protein
MQVVISLSVSEIRWSTDEKTKKTHPYSTGMSRTMKSLGCVFPEILGNRQTQEEGNASDEQVPH